MVLNDIISDNIELDSKDEMYFEWFLNDMVETGYVKEYFRAKTLPVTNGISYEYTQQMKTKTKTLSRTVSPPLVYTADYVIVWDDKAEGVFYQRYDYLGVIEKDLDKPKFFPMMLAKELDSGEVVSVVDVKPSMNSQFNTYGSSREFVSKQALVYNKYDLIVDRVKVIHLMKTMFTSKRYMWTDAKKQLRKLKWSAITIEEYVDKVQTIKNGYSNT